MLLLSQSLPVLHPFFEAFIFRHLLLEIQTAVLFLEKNLGKRSPYSDLAMGLMTEESCFDSR